MKPDLSVKIGKLNLKNPVMPASGTFGYAEEFSDFINLKNLGAIVTKTITMKPRKGNLMPRTCETAAGMLNSIGLENPGLESFIKDKLPLLKKIGVPIIVSIASEGGPQEFVELAKRLNEIKEIAGLELNISCPNVNIHPLPEGERVRVRGLTSNETPSSSSSPLRGEEESGKNLSRIGALSTSSCAYPALISQDPKATYNVVSAVRKVTSKTLITKLSPNVTDIVEIAKSAEAAGSDAVSLINTLMGMSIDINTRKPKIAAVTGGLSGPAVKPVALRMVWEASRAVKVPVIGIGGIMTAADAIEFIIAGATAVQIGTANFINPQSAQDVIDGLTRYLKENKLESITKLKGSLKL